MSIQGAVNQTIGTLGVVTKLFDMGKMKQATKSAEQLKLAKLKQQAEFTKAKAQIAKNKLSITQSKEKLKEFKQNNNSGFVDTSIGKLPKELLAKSIDITGRNK